VHAIIDCNGNGLVGNKCSIINYSVPQIVSTVASLKQRIQKYVQICVSS